MKRLLIANRGEIARRILRAARSRGFSVAVVSVASDSDALVRREVDAVLEVSSFLAAREIVEAAKHWGADFLHPGYGFLSENAAFAEMVEDSQMVFVGPTPENMRLLGAKESAKRFAAACDVPTLPAVWDNELKDIRCELWPELFQQRGLRGPFLVKASCGGGGRGMRVAKSISDLPQLVDWARLEAASGFGDGAVFVEPYLENCRHIEVQFFGDGLGRAVALGDRECSVQRRHQKLIEEAPAPFLLADLRARLASAAVRLAEKSCYRGVGTAEMLLSANGEFHFIEVNTRLQVEHTVTEKVLGVDLVQAQLDLAEGVWPRTFSGICSASVQGSAMEARIVAEDPRRNFIPTPGTIVRYREPNYSWVRVDSGVGERSRINPEFDSLVAKVIASGTTREEARTRLLVALEDTVVHGCETNLSFLSTLLCHHDFISGRVGTEWIEQNQESLSRPILPKALLDIFYSESFCEQLSLALCGGLPRRSALYVEKFRSVGNDYLCIGSTIEEKPWRVVTRNLCEGRFYAEGCAIAEAVLSAAGELERFPEAFQRAFARAALNPQGFVLDFVATRVSQIGIAISCLGEALTVNSPRYVARRVAGNVGTVREVKAPLAGKVVAAHVVPGEVVKPGQLMFVLESMKMLFDIRADGDGLVESVAAQSGAVLTGPQVLAVLSPV